MTNIKTVLINKTTVTLPIQRTTRLDSSKSTDGCSQRLACYYVNRLATIRLLFFDNK